MELGPIILAPAPRPGRDAEEYRRKVADWTRAAESAIRKLEATIRTLGEGGGGSGLPTLPNDATKFLDGTGAFDTVKDSDLSTSDITTNDVSTTKHGFAPKAPNDATKFLDGTGAYSIPTGVGSGSVWDLELTKPSDQDVTNNATYQDDTFLTGITLDANCVYRIEAWIVTSGNNTSADYKGQFAFGTTVEGIGTVQFVSGGLAASSAVSGMGAGGVVWPVATLLIGTTGFLTQPFICRLEFQIVTSSGASSMKYQFANAVAGSGRISRTWKGSVVKVKKISTVV